MDWCSVSPKAYTCSFDESFCPILCFFFYFACLSSLHVYRRKQNDAITQRDPDENEVVTYNNVARDADDDNSKELHFQKKKYSI